MVSHTHAIQIAAGVLLGALAVILVADPGLAFAGTSTVAASNPGAAGSQVETILQSVAGPILIGGMAVRGVGHYLNHDTGKAIGHLGLGALAAIPIYAGPQLKDGLESVANTLGSSLGVVNMAHLVAGHL